MHKLALGPAALLGAKLQVVYCCLILFGGVSANGQSVQRIPGDSQPTAAAGNAPASVDGTWEGVLKFPGSTLHIVLHISGPDDDLKATNDSPDQDIFGHPVDSISFQGSTLRLEILSIKVRFTGDLMANGSITGTFVQRGTGIPLALTRSEGVAPPPPASGSVQDGRYHHDQTGIEFDLPPGFSVPRTANYMNNNGWLATLADSEHRNPPFAAWMARRRILANHIPTVLAGEVPAKIVRRKTLDSHYEIPSESIERTAIGGQLAIKATAHYEFNGTKMVELLTWIVSERTVVHFYAMIPADSLQDLQWRFDQMVESARVP